MKPCYCNSALTYEDCCGKFIDGLSLPKTAEELMRSRYSAYAQAKIDYIEQTMSGKAAENFDKVQTAIWAESVKWIGLKVLSASQASNKACVEFIAMYCANHKLYKLHEKSEFSYMDGQWFYIDGELFNESPQAIGRNDVCPCASGKKYKKCCGKSS